VIYEYLISKYELAIEDFTDLFIRFHLEIGVGSHKGLDTLQTGREFAFFIHPEFFNSI
jgi:hypothetical protein